MRSSSGTLAVTDTIPPSLFPDTAGRRVPWRTSAWPGGCLHPNVRGTPRWREGALRARTGSRWGSGGGDGGPQPPEHRVERLLPPRVEHEVVADAGELLHGSAVARRGRADGPDRDDPVVGR